MEDGCGPAAVWLASRWLVPVVLAGLLLLPTLGSPGVLLPRHPPVPADVLGPGVDLYPSFPLGDEIVAVAASPNATPPGEMLALVTLQGIVNRASVRLYVDPGEDWKGGLITLGFLQQRYGLRVSWANQAQVFKRFAPEARGVVVYDPSRPSTVNLATIYAGLEDLIAADPGFAEVLMASTGLPVLIDLRREPWGVLGDGEGVVSFSLRELYEKVDRRRIVSLRPDRFGLRDYAVATRSFVFYLPQGPLATPSSVALTEEVLASFPQGIPVLGWFETATKVEENFFVQRSSRYGKILLGGEDLLDVTVLTSLGRGMRYSLGARPTGVALEEKIYVAFAVPDGDNLDFLVGRMAKLWSESGRGRIPLAWSINPGLVELAPPLLEYYSSTSSPLDSFVAGPSGSGYLYPGFVSEEALEVHLARTAEAMVATGLREVWLLNAFTPYEVSYPPSVLASYTAALAPRGIILDYGDMATTRNYWMVAGAGEATAVIRTTHMWSSFPNFQGKVRAEVDSLGGGPHFIFAATYPWSFGPSDALAALDALRGRYGERVVAVSVADLFDLVGRHFLRDAMEGRGWGGRVTWPDSSEARTYVKLAEAEAASGNVALAGYYGQEAMEARDTSEAMVGLAILVAVAALLMALLALYSRRRPPLFTGPPWAALSLGLIILGFAVGTRSVLHGNFWNYYLLPVGLAVGIGCARALGGGGAGRGTILGATLTEGASLVLLPLTPFAFIPLAAAATVALVATLGKNPRLTADLVIGAWCGVWTSVLQLPSEVLAAGVAMAGLLPASQSLLRPLPVLGRHGRAPSITGLALASVLPLAILPLEGLHWFHIRMQPFASLETSSLLLPALALALALALARLGNGGWLVGAAAAVPASALVLLLLPPGLPVAAGGLALLTSIVHLALRAARRPPVQWRDGGRLALRWPTLAVAMALVAVLPGMTYSLAIELPTAVEYVLYTAPMVIAAAGSLLLLLILPPRPRREPGGPRR